MDILFSLLHGTYNLTNSISKHRAIHTCGQMENVKDYYNIPVHIPPHFGDETIQ